MTWILFLVVAFALSFGAAELLRWYQEREWKREFLEPRLRAAAGELMEIAAALRRDLEQRNAALLAERDQIIAARGLDVPHVNVGMGKDLSDEDAARLAAWLGKPGPFH